MPLPSIPQSSPGANYLARKEALDAAIRRVLDSGWYILGQEGAAFEREFAAYLGAAHAVGVANGTDALQLALRAGGVGAGDMVFTVAHTAVATAAAITLCGATPVFVDIDPARFTLDPARLEDALARQDLPGRPRAIVPVHLYGQMADMPAILDIARRHDLLVVEDCAQAHGAALNGRRAGTWGDAAAFSFYPTKNLGALGDGGAVVTNTPALAEQVRLLRQYGWGEQRISQVPGGNSRLDELQAAVLRVKLAHLDEDNGRRRALASLYDRLLARTGLTLPCVVSGAAHVFHQYVVRSARRDACKAHLQAQGIGTLVHYPVPVHQQPAYSAVMKAASLPETERTAREVLSLPLYPELPHEDAQRVAEAVTDWAQTN